jgi:hypothetical protein
MGVPEAIVQVPSGGPFNALTGDFLVPDATLQKIWRVPQNGGAPATFSFELGISAIGGLFLPSNWGDNTGKFLTSGFGSGSSSILIFEPNGDFAFFLNQEGVTFADAVIAPSGFGTLGGNLLVADEGGKVWVVTPGGVSTQLGPNLGFLAFGVTFAPAGFGTIGGKLLVSNGNGGNIVALDANGTVTPFITLTLEQGQTGLRQMAFSPAGFIPGVGTLLFVSVSGSQAGGGTLGDVLALDSTGTTVFSLRRDLGLTTFDPRGLLFTEAGLLVSDASVGKILRITSEDFAFVDNDGDTVPNIDDNCVFTYNPDQVDGDGDGVGDACDNCPFFAASTDQTDDNNNLIGDVCEDSNNNKIVDYKETVQVQTATARPGGPLIVTCTFLYDGQDTNGDGVADPITTVGCDCFNTLFTVKDSEGNILPPHYRHPAYGIPDGLVTHQPGDSCTVQCDLSEMFHSSVLTSGTVQCTYANYIQDRDFNPVTGECAAEPCFDIWTGAVTSPPANITIDGAPVQRVEIDITPGSFPNTVNCNNKNEQIPVAVLGSNELDVSTIDVNTVRFGRTGIEVQEIHRNKDKTAVSHVPQDLNNDGFLDKIFHFPFVGTGFSCADIPADQKEFTVNGILTGKANGTDITDSETLRLKR